MLLCLQLYHPKNSNLRALIVKRLIFKMRNYYWYFKNFHFAILTITFFLKYKVCCAKRIFLKTNNNFQLKYIKLSSTIMRETNVGFFQDKVILFFLSLGDKNQHVNVHKYYIFWPRGFFYTFKIGYFKVNIRTNMIDNA